MMTCVYEVTTDKTPTDESQSSAWGSFQLTSRNFNDALRKARKRLERGERIRDLRLIIAVKE